MDTLRAQDVILSEIARARLRYEATVERGDIDAARQVRAKLSGMLAELGQANPELEERMRREMKFPEFRPLL